MMGTNFDADKPVPRLFIFRRACPPKNTLTRWLQNGTFSQLRYTDHAQIFLVPCERLWTVGEERSLSDKQKYRILSDFATAPKQHLDRLKACFSDTSNNVPWYVDQQEFVNMPNVTISSVFDFLTREAIDNWNPLNKKLFDGRYFIRMRINPKGFALTRSINHRCAILELGAMGIAIKHITFHLGDCQPGYPWRFGDDVALLVTAADSRKITIWEVAFSHSRLPMVFAARNFDPNSKYTDLIDVDAIQIYHVASLDTEVRFHMFVYDFVGHMIIDLNSGLTGLTRASGNIFRVENLKRRTDLVMFFGDAIKYSTKDELEDRIKGAGIEIYGDGEERSLMLLYVAIGIASACGALDLVILVFSAVREPLIKNTEANKRLPRLGSKKAYDKDMDTQIKSV